MINFDNFAAQNMKRFSLIFTLFVIITATGAQTMEVGVFGGGTYYIGDLNPTYHFLQTRPAYGIVAKYNHGTRWAFRLTGYRGKVVGNDSVSHYNEVRGLSFESNIIDVAGVVEFNFLDYFTGSKRDDMTSYIFGGIGYVHFDPRYDGSSLRDMGTEGQNVGFEGRPAYKKYTFTLPFGIGFKYSLNSRLGLALEWGVRKTFSDYLDDVSTTYYLDGEQINPDNVAEVRSDPTFSHKPYQERGNPKTNDWYSFLGVSLTYKFNPFGGKGCYDQKR